jgi:uncharacterized integral membrane protein (TIGR00698 family)
VGMLSRGKQLAPGVALCTAIAGGGWLLELAEQHFAGRAYVEALVLAIILGAIVRSAWTPDARFTPGIRTSGHFLLEVAVVLLGASIDAALVERAGPTLLAGVLVIVATTLIAGYAISRAFGLPHRMALLVATGNAICGNSAIAAVAPVIEANGDDVGAAIGFTAVLGVAAVLGLPVLGQALHLSAVQYGALAGLTVYAVPQVLAATLPVSVASAQVGTLVKLTRVLMLGPVVIILAFLHNDVRSERHIGSAMFGTADRCADASPRSKGLGFGRMVPWFIVGFLLMGIARTVGLLPAWLPVPLRTAATALTVLSMAALGLAVDARSLVRVGARVTASVIGALAILLALSLTLLHTLAIH